MDVRNINTSQELAALESQIDSEINSLSFTGGRPEDARKFNDQMTTIKRDIITEDQRHATSIRSLAQRLANLHRDISNSPKNQPH